MEALERNLILLETTQPCGALPISTLKKGFRHKLNGLLIDDHCVYSIYYRDLFSFIPIRMSVICFPRFGRLTIESLRAINIFDFMIVFGFLTLIKLVLSSLLTTDARYILSEVAD